MTKQQKAIEYFDGYGSPYDEYLIDLLERDMPMKVSAECLKVKALDIETEEVVTFDTVPCPKCAKWLLSVNNYCQHCGQRLKEE